MVNKISLLSGHGRHGRKEDFSRIDMTMGQVVSIVGPTGSGKTTLINDIELFAEKFDRGDIAKDGDDLANSKLDVFDVCASDDHAASPS